MIAGDASSTELAVHRPRPLHVPAGSESIVAAVGHVLDADRDATIEGYEIAFETGGNAYRGTALMRGIVRVHRGCRAQALRS